MTVAATNQPGALMGFVHRSRRGAELFLLVLALLVGVGAYAAVGLGVRGEIPVNIVMYGGWLTALAVAAHVTMRFVAPYADPVLLPVVVALNGLGLSVIYRLDLARNKELATQQLVWMTLGVVLFIVTLLSVRDHRVLQRFTYTSALAAVVLLLMPMLPVIGHSAGGANIWIKVGGLTFQPGEIAKVLLVVAFAGYLVQHRDVLALAGRRILFIDLPRARDLLPILLMWLVSLAILAAQKDLGSALLFFGLFLVLLYVATERPGWIIVGSALFAVGATVAYFAFGHVRNRVRIWQDPMAFYEAQPGSGQLVDGLFGMAWGGLIGRGFGDGEPWRIPVVESDFIVNAIGEELGLTGVMAILLCYGLIVERALRTALICRDGFGKLLTVGLGTVLALQVFVVVGGVTGLIPLTGLTTPFLSYGGSSLVANWVIVALVARVSDHARRPPPDLTPVADEGDAETTQVVKLR